MYLNNQCDYTCYHDDKGKEVTISHVHKHHPFPQDSDREPARPSAAWVSILFLWPLLLGQGPVVLYDGIFNIWTKPRKYRYHIRWI